MKRALYNPLKNDFSVKYDINGDMNPITFTIPSSEVKVFGEDIYEHIKKHLADRIINERELNPTIPHNREDVLKEIEVEI